MIFYLTRWFPARERARAIATFMTAVLVAGVIGSPIMGPLWALATSSVRGVGAAASIALINSVGNTGGFVGPYLLGAINDATHSFAVGLLAIAAMLVTGAVLVLSVRDVATDPRVQPEPTHGSAPTRGNAVRREKPRIHR